MGVTEYASTALKTITDQEVADDLRHVTQTLKLPFKKVETGFGVDGPEELGPASRHYLAMKRLIKDNNLDGLAIR